MTALDLTKFRYDNIDIRTLVIDGQPWFVGVDVCKALGILNPRDALGRLDADGVGNADVIDSMGRTQTAKVISEAGLYELIFQSRTVFATDFRKWVTSEVLPSIRKTGQYGASPVAELTRSDLARMILDAEAELAQSRVEVEVQTQRAALAEENVAAFENDKGIVVRAFIQKHFPDERESTLWSFFYGRGYVVNDPRGRWSDTQQKRIPGANHHMPLQPGREWFHAPEQLDSNKKPRRQLRIRRDRELDLVAHLERHGFTSIRSTSLDVFGSASTPRAV